MKTTETRSGAKTLAIDGIQIHSKYSPEKEAEKFISANLTTKSTIIILGAGLGYIFKTLEENYPEIKVISIPFNRELGELSWELNPSNRVQWDFLEPINRFLNKSITEKNIKDLQVLQWNPCVKVFTDISDRINSAILSRIRRVNGNLLTTARFGKKWIQNSIRNFLNINSYIKAFNINRPVVIISSGASLEKSIHLLKEIRDSVTIISLSSANCALKYYGIEPDITFSTDPGYYSKLHVYNHKNIIAMPLTNSTSDNQTVLLLNQRNSFEEELITLGGLPSVKVNENGTVAGTALEFALNYSSGKVYLFGQDLAPTDIQSHIKPYTFDSLLKSSDNRVHPYYSIMYERYLKSGVSYQTYRDWFSACGFNNPDRIFRVNSNSTPIPGIKDIQTKDLLVKIGKTGTTPPINIETTKLNNITERHKLIRNLLNNWIKSFDQKKIEENPLFYLISTSKYTDVNSKALSETEMELVKKEGKEESILFIKRLLKLYGRKLL